MEAKDGYGAVSAQGGDVVTLPAENNLEGRAQGQQNTHIHTHIKGIHQAPRGKAKQIDIFTSPRREAGVLEEYYRASIEFVPV